MQIALAVFAHAHARVHACLAIVFAALRAATISGLLSKLASFVISAYRLAFQAVSTKLDLKF